jgi:hypothetical protein
LQADLNCDHGMRNKQGHGTVTELNEIGGFLTSVRPMEAGKAQHFR